MGTINKGLFSSNKQTWETPKELFDKLNNIFKFELDVCAVEETAKCKRYFNPQLDGLKQKWEGICWMNPPYGREQVKWISKAKEEATKNNSTVACLIPARPDTKVWQDIIFRYATAICFIKGRLKFGNNNNSAPFPSALVVFGKINEGEKNILCTLGKTF